MQQDSSPRLTFSCPQAEYDTAPAMIDAYRPDLPRFFTPVSYTHLTLPPILLV